MIGLLVLALLAGYLMVVAKLASFIARMAGFERSILKVSAVFAILVLLPFVDEIVGRFQFEHECRKVQGYTVMEAIKTASWGREGDWPPPTVQVPAFIPITKRTSSIFGADGRTVLMSFDSVSTPGGWLMRAGLNLDTTSFCNSVNAAKVMMSHGFEPLNDGIYQRKPGTGPK